MRRLLRVVLVTLSALLAGSPAPTIAEEALKSAADGDARVAITSDGQDWPGFLGPDRTGVSSETGLLPVWPKAGPPIVWQRAVGTGYSAPSVLGNRLVLHHRLGNDEIVECFDAVTGDSLWKHATPTRFRDPYGYNNGPRCSPMLRGDRCFTLGAAGKLLCLQLSDGAAIWEHDLQSEFTIPEGFFGMGASPWLEGDSLIVAVGGQPNSGLVSFHAETGEIRWQRAGQETWEGIYTGWDSEPVHNWSRDDMIVSYSSPVCVTIHGVRHLLCFLRHGLVSLNPETGDQRFAVWFRSRTHESVNAAQPVIVGDTILLGSAYRTGSRLFSILNDNSSVEEMWAQRTSLALHWSTAVALNRHYFGFSGRHENEGVLQCVDARTGQVRWESTGWERPEDLARGADETVVDRTTGETIPWPFYGRGSMILADGKLIILGERGTLALVEARTDACVEVSRCSVPHMQYPSWTAPVLSRKQLYLRGEETLVRMNLDPAATALTTGAGR